MNTGTTETNTVEQELADSFIEYALAVIISRAIPDARDGLKPVQRRLLHAMHEAGLHSDRPHRKSIAAVADTMKHYHPHGDQAIYDTLVRLAQPWVMQLPLIDGHGNYGSPDDGPAAARYTEARLTPAAEALLQDLDADTVTHTPNYDNTRQEPTCLPAAYPNLLINGVTGIAVGMATDIPPHNPTETINAAIHLLHHPNATTTDLIHHIAGPDFPTGGTLIDDGHLTDAYTTGKGKARLRATATITHSRRHHHITITELPYNTGPERIITRVKQTAQTKQLDTITDIKDLTDRTHGTRIVIDIKKSGDPHHILDQLYQHTPLETTIKFNAVALINNKPETADLHTLLTTFIHHRLDVTRRRTRHHLQQTQARIHLTEALLTALNQLDTVITIIRNANTTTTARTQLQKRLNLTKTQATHILDMPLRRLTKLEHTDLTKQQQQLQTQAADLQHILDDETKQRALVHTELAHTATRIGRPRRTRIEHHNGTTTEPAAPTPGIDWTAQWHHTTGLWRTQTPTPAAGHYHGTLHHPISYITSDGHLHSTTIEQLATQPDPSRPCLAVVPDRTALLLVTAHGVVKRLTPDTWPARPAPNGTRIITLQPGDTIVHAGPCIDTDIVNLITTGGQLLRFNAATIRPSGRPAAGVAGINLNDADTVITAAAHPADSAHVLTVGTDRPAIKTAALTDYPTKGRNTAGVRIYPPRKGDTRITAAVITATPPAGHEPTGRAAPATPTADPIPEFLTPPPN